MDPEEAAQRDAATIADLASGREPEPPPRPRLGEGLYRGDEGGYLSWQGRIDVEGRSDVRFDDVFGAAALIIRARDKAESLSRQQIERLRQLGIVAACFDLAFTGTEGVGAICDTKETYAEWFTGISADPVLVRPDLYVYGAESGAGAATGLAEAYSSAVGSPGSGTGEQIGAHATAE